LETVRVPFRLALVVTSDRVYRGEKRDEVTPLVEEWARARGVVLSWRTVVPNDPVRIRRAVARAVTHGEVVLVTGGTGLSPRDVSVDVVEGLAWKRVPGLGEEHRRRSMERVGARALLSRASGYVVGASLVFVSPGSPDAVQVSLSLLEEAGAHFAEQARGGRGHGGKH